MCSAGESESRIFTHHRQSINGQKRGRIEQPIPAATLICRNVLARRQRDDGESGKRKRAPLIAAAVLVACYGSRWNNGGGS
jgi:hypothetical protein